MCHLTLSHTEELFRGFQALIGPASIQYANDEDWLQRRQWLYSTLKGKDLQLYFPHFVKIAQETEECWSGYAADQRVRIVKETFPMTIRGICRSCLGDVFEGTEEVEKLADCYHKCWREMEVRRKGRERERIGMKKREIGKERERGWKREKEEKGERRRMEERQMRIK